MYTHLLRIVYMHMLRISMVPFSGSQGMKMARLKEMAPFFRGGKNHQAPSVETGKRAHQILGCPTDSWRHTRPQFFRI